MKQSTVIAAVQLLSVMGYSQFSLSEVAHNLERIISGQDSAGKSLTD